MQEWATTLVLAKCILHNLLLDMSLWLVLLSPPMEIKEPMVEVDHLVPRRSHRLSTNFNLVHFSVDSYLRVDSQHSYLWFLGPFRILVFQNKLVCKNIRVNWDCLGKDVQVEIEGFLAVGMHDFFGFEVWRVRGGCPDSVNDRYIIVFWIFLSEVLREETWFAISIVVWLQQKLIGQNVFGRGESLILTKDILDGFINFWALVVMARFSVFKLKCVVLEKILKLRNEVNAEDNRENSTDYHADPFKRLLRLVGDPTL